MMRSIFMIACISITCTIQATLIIWKEPGICWEENQSHVQQHVYNALSWWGKSLVALEYCSQEPLEEKPLRLLNEHDPEGRPPHDIYYKNVLLPRILRRWLLGNTAEDTAQQEIRYILKKANPSSGMQALIPHIIPFMCSADGIVKTLSCRHETLNIIQDLNKQHHTNVIFSNINANICKKLYETHNTQELFKYIGHTHVYTCEQQQQLLPSIDLIQQLIQTYNESHCIYIEPEKNSYLPDQNYTQSIIYKNPNQLLQELNDPT